MPCKNGWNRAAERLALEERLRHRDPYHKLWLRLVDIVDESPDGIGGLSEPEKYYFSVSLLDLEVHNGGFEQYFFNSSATYYSLAVDGLIEIDAIWTWGLLIQAKDLLFPLSDVPADTNKRRELLLDRSVELPELDELNRLYCLDLDSI